jgi:hypothetical protein
MVVKICNVLVLCYNVRPKKIHICVLGGTINRKNSNQQLNDMVLCHLIDRILNKRYHCITPTSHSTAVKSHMYTSVEPLANSNVNQIVLWGCTFDTMNHYLSYIVIG